MISKQEEKKTLIKAWECIQMLLFYFPGVKGRGAKKINQGKLPPLPFDIHKET